MESKLILTDLRNYPKIQEKLDCNAFTFLPVSNKTIRNFDNDERVFAVVGSRALVRSLESIALPSCKLVQLESTGYDDINIEYFSNNGIALCNASGIYNNCLAEYVVYAMLSHAKRFHKSMKWNFERPLRNYHYMSEVAGKTVGIMGTGSIGTSVAKRLTGFNVKIIGYARKSNNVNHFDEIYHQDTFFDFLSKCDYLVNILPHTPYTKELLNIDAFNHLKKDVVFINIGRESVYNKKALLDFFKNNREATAVLDIFEYPIIRWLNPLRWCPNIKIYPRIAAISKESENSGYKLFSDNIMRAYNDDVLINRIN